jgi:hypothetical protein
MDTKIPYRSFLQGISVLEAGLEPAQPFLAKGF